MKKFNHWLNEAMSLKGDYKGTFFQRLVAAQYVLSPMAQPEAIAGYRDLMRKISRQNNFLQSKFQFNPTTDDPYRSMKHMTKEIEKQQQAGIKKPTFNVYAEPPQGTQIPLRAHDAELPGSEGHPFFSNDQNVTLRGVHDAIAHYMGQHPFSARGEYAAYNRHLKTLCNIEQVKNDNCSAAKVLFTEIIGQTSYYYVYGSYTVQKAVILSDFNHWNVGSLAPNSGLNSFFELSGKSLVTRPDFEYINFQKQYASLAQEMKRQLSAKSLITLARLPGEDIERPE